MEFNSKNIQLQYQGFLNTGLLWKNTFYGLEQLVLPPIPTAIFQGTLTKNPRLGKRVESFVSCYLQQFENIKIIHENIQIQKEKITIGELDCILTQAQTPIHLEIVFKYYLFDKTVGTSEIEHWIGPNRTDSLEQKIKKLSSKQLPLLYKEETQKQVTIDVANIQQKVYFKAQLFVPYATQDVHFEQLNSACVAGFYMYQHELLQFTECKFYIPSKIDWLLAAHKNIKWMSFGNFKEHTAPLLEAKKSPLCWLKYPNGELSKFFLVFWEPQAL